jgi:putative endonuclease
MASVYIIYSKKIDSYYIGSYINLEERLWEHNNHIFDRSFTRRADDWSIFFKIDNLPLTTARKVENHIKKMKSRKYIENLTKYPEIASTLIQKYGGSSR